MYLIDTNIHAAYLLQNIEDDELTLQYLNLYDTIALSERIIPDFILAELETFILKVIPARYKLGTDDKQKLKELALDYLHRLTHECTIVVPSIDIVKHARDLYFANATTHYMSFIDCLVLATAKHNKYILFTKDTRMKMIAKQLNIQLLAPPITGE